MNTIRHGLLVFIVLSYSFSYSQDKDSSINALSHLPDKYYSKVDKKISSLDEKLTKKSLKYLAKFEKQDRKLQQKIKRLRIDSTTNAFAPIDEKYKELSQNIKSKTSSETKLIGQYNPYLDSLGTSLSFLKQFNGFSDKVKEPLAGLNQLQSKLQQSDKIKEFIAERKNQIKELLSKYTKIPGSLKKQYDNLSKTAYYYSAQVKEYKEMLKDPKKVEQKALGILSKLPAFQKFMKQNGQLASLFSLPGNGNPAQNLMGLQTRASVQGLIQERVASGRPNAQAQIQANLTAAHTELNKLKDKLNEFGGNSSGEAEIPDFKPNNQKTKSLLKRLEYSADIQFAKSSALLPSAANIGLGVGYKLNDKSAIGIGLNYKLGMGSVRHISFTSQGIGLRSYMDWKIKKQIYASGGYELNYNTTFKSIEQLKNYAAWQRSALLGVSKKYKISKKVQGEMKILYDFLANEHIPVSQQVLFRLGYKF